MIIGDLEKGVLIIYIICSLGLGGDRYLMAVAVWPKNHVLYASSALVNCGSPCRVNNY